MPTRFIIFSTIIHNRIIHNNISPSHYFPSPILSSDYPTQLCLFNHHIIIGCTFIAGAGAHASISMIRDVLQLHQPYQNHRDVIIGHLITICILLGFHSFSLYIHNDTFQALGHPEDIFSNNSIQLNLATT
jgi:photosystem I P700 chlorophyll a apoprotein A1